MLHRNDDMAKQSFWESRKQTTYFYSKMSWYHEKDLCIYVIRDFSTFWYRKEQNSFFVSDDVVLSKGPTFFKTDMVSIEKKNNDDHASKWWQCNSIWKISPSHHMPKKISNSIKTCDMRWMNRIYIFVLRNEGE
jgi:hypothetical protein